MCSAILKLGVASARRSATVGRASWRATCFAVLLLLPRAEPAKALNYAVTPGAADVVEYELRSNGFKFGALLKNDKNQVYFRGQPDRLAHAAAGTTWYLGPFFPDGDVGTGSYGSVAVNAADTGIDFAAGGAVPTAGGSYGTWNMSGTISYDASQSRVISLGSLDIALSGALAAKGLDLNLERFASNYIANYMGQGPTGDMQRALAHYDPVDGIVSNDWAPTMGNHFPPAMSHSLGIDVIGSYNAAFGEYKPSYELKFTSASTTMFAGFGWDDTKQGINDDNIGINHLVRHVNNIGTNFHLTYELVVTPFPHPGDYNGDFRVDGLDLLMWQRQFNASGGTIGADGNRDGQVDAADLAIWKQNFGASEPSVNAIAAPEPPACLLALCLPMRILVGHRRRLADEWRAC